MLIFSFLAWYKLDFFGESESWSAWSNAFNLFPLATLVVLLGVGLAAAVGAARFGGVSLPGDVAGFSWSDLRLLFGILATLTLLTYLLRDTAEVDKGIGLIITTLAAIGFLVGAVLERQSAGVTDAADEVGSGGQPSPGSLVLMLGGLVLLIGSFLSVASDTSAWGEVAFPLYTLPAILGVIVAGQLALSEFAGTRVPGVLGLSWPKIRLGFSAWAALMMICLLIGEAGVEGSSADKEIGFWIMLLGSLALLAGAVMRHGEGARPAATTTRGGTPPPPPPPA
jgi:hypothetical protein